MKAITKNNVASELRLINHNQCSCKNAILKYKALSIKDFHWCPFTVTKISSRTWKVLIFFSNDFQYG